MEPRHGIQRRTISALAILAVALLVGATLTGCTAFETGGDSVQVDDTLVGRDAVAPEYSEGEMYDEGLAEGASTKDAAASAAPTTVDPDYSGERLVVRSVSMRIEVDDVAASVDEVRAATEAAGGIVSTLHVSTDESPVYRYEAEGSLADGAPLSGYITVRVPSEQLDTFSEAVASLGTVLREDANQDDVTQQYVDLEARLKNLQAREERLRALYDEADTVEDTLAVDRELSAVRGEIEAMQAQITYLEGQAAMATVTIELIEPTPVVRPAGENWGFADAITSSLRAFMTTINGMIIILGGILPLILVGLIVAVIVIVIVRIRHRRGGNVEESDDSSS